MTVHQEPPVSPCACMYNLCHLKISSLQTQVLEREKKGGVRWLPQDRFLPAIRTNSLSKFPWVLTPSSLHLRTLLPVAISKLLTDQLRALSFKD